MNSDGVFLLAGLRKSRLVCYTIEVRYYAYILPELSANLTMTEDSEVRSAPEPNHSVSPLSKQREARRNRTESHRRILVVFAWLAVGLAAVMTTHQLSPLFDRQQEVEELLRSSEYKREQARLQSDLITQGAEEASRSLSFHRSEFVSLSLTLYAKFKSPEQGRPEIVLSYDGVKANLRYDQVILFFGIYVIVFSAIAFLFKRRPDLEQHSSYSRWAETRNDAVQFHMGRTPEEILESEVATALARSEELYSRSTLLLTGGIVMAFIGVGIFYVSLPDMNSFSGTGKSDGATLENYLVSSIRPTGVLLFLEAIAWFLLRQYRALIEDYKTFHRMYLKRANYLISLKTLSQMKSPGIEAALVASLLGEDHSGVLRDGETTESLESQRGAAANPVFSLLSTFVGRMQPSAGKGQ